MASQTTEAARGANPISISRRVNEIKPSVVRSVLEAATRYEQAGHRVIHLEIDGAVEVLRLGRPLVKDMVSYDERARTMFVDGLNLLGLSCPAVEGTIHAFPATTSIAPTSEEAASILLEQCGVAGTPGTAYGSAGAGRVRFSSGAAPIEDLEDAIDRIERLGRQVRTAC